MSCWCHINVILKDNNDLDIIYYDYHKIKREKMKLRRQISASARRKQLKVQHNKINTRRQFFFNQVVAELNDPQNIKNN